MRDGRGSLPAAAASAAPRPPRRPRSEAKPFPTLDGVGAQDLARRRGQATARDDQRLPQVKRRLSMLTGKIWSFLPILIHEAGGGAE